MVNIRKTHNRTINVSVVNKSKSGIIDPVNPVVLKNIPTLNGEGATRLSDLLDVDASKKTKGSVPIYDPPTDTYYVENLDLKYVSGDLDGGEF